MLKHSLEPIRKFFGNNFETKPLRITTVCSDNFDLEYCPGRNYGTSEFTHGGAWWAHRSGFSEEMSKNDVPNISIIAYPAGLDITINAEVSASQKVMLKKIQESTSCFDMLVACG